MFQPTLTDAPPPEPPIEWPDPWKHLRAKYPDHYIVRRIDVPSEMQAFLAIPKTRKNIESGAGLWDGATFWTPAPPPPSANHAEYMQTRQAAAARWDADPALRTEHPSRDVYVGCAMAEAAARWNEQGARVMAWFARMEQDFNVIWEGNYGDTGSETTTIRRNPESGS